MTTPPYAWALFTVAAAAAQTARNAMQRGLTAKVGVAAASWARFIFALPFALAFLAVVLSFETGSVSVRDGFGVWLLIGSLAQMAGTATMLLAMRDRSFVTVTAYLKTEPIQVAAFSFAFLGEPLTPLRFAAVVLGTAAVMLMSWPPASTKDAFGAAGRDLRGAGWGVAAAAAFAMAAVGYRGAVTHLDGVSFLSAATLALAATLTIQTLLSIAWLLIANRTSLPALFVAWRESVPAGFAGAIASQCWFLALALQAAPAVRTLALVEVVFAQLVSWRLLREKVSRREIAGMALLAVALIVILRT
ncbi:MAG TPA: EamA family transporter [Burkholderiales bacterium]|nr:EamA family transporter [Burkholderiales bacterium]